MAIAEGEPVMGVWGLCLSPGAKPLVRGEGDFVPLKLTNFCKCGVSILRKEYILNTLIIKLKLYEAVLTPMTQNLSDENCITLTFIIFCLMFTWRMHSVEPLDLT